MYERFFGLSSSPFNVNPDPRFLFLTRSAQEALASLSYGIRMKKGFVLLTGEVGTGKTTLVNRLLDWLRGHRVATAFIFNPMVNIPQFFDLVMADFGLECGSMDKSRMLLRLNSWLLEKHRSGETAVLVIDEAQNLSTEVLEEVRLLTNLETSTQKLLQIILSGQPELDQKLKLPQLRQLNQRVTLRCRTEKLSEDETLGYIELRLRTAGATTRIFSPEAAASVFRHTHGIPRLVNVLCEHSLISAYVDQQQHIGPETVDRIASDLEIEATASVNIKPNGHSSQVEDYGSTSAGQLSTLDERLQEISVNGALRGTDR